MPNTMNEITKEFLEIVSEFKDGFKGAFNLRENGQCIGRLSSENVTIEAKTDKPGIIVTVAPNTVGETVYIPTCVTHGGLDDVVYNDFNIGENCDIRVIAGCGVHTETNTNAKHSGVHMIHIGANSHVEYIEKHIGTGEGTGNRVINPVTNAFLAPNAVMEINATQISGLDNAYRTTNAQLEEGAQLIVRERLFTECEQITKTHFKVELNGEGSSADIVSRSFAKDASYQSMDSVIIGNAACKGHSECDSIIDGDAVVEASPRLFAHNKEAALIHEAAIGKIAGEQIMKLRTLGLTEEQAEAEIINGFLS